MTGIACSVRRTVVAVVLAELSQACTPKPESIAITGPTSCREGTTIQVSAQVMDGKGRVLPLPITWTLDPPAAGKLDGPNLTCLAEGALSLRATAGVSATQKISITSPLIGTWVRQFDTYAGMKLRISAATDGSLSAYIVGAPNDAALPAIKREHKTNDDVADALLGCFAHIWAPGLKKWDEIKRLNEKRWSLTDLHKAVTVLGANCRENEAKSRYDKDFELTLVGVDKLELHNLRVTAPPQIWDRIADIDEAALASLKAICDKAREVAEKAYAEVVPTVSETEKVVSGKFWSGNGSLTEFQTTQRLAATLKAAQSSLSDGAYKARRAARAVPTNDAVPNLKTVRDASEAMYNACKDVSP